MDRCTNCPFLAICDHDEENCSFSDDNDDW